MCMRAKFFLLVSSMMFPCVLFAGPLAQTHVALDLIKLSRDSSASVDYVYDNSGTVNTAADDTVLGSSGDFDDDADNGYVLSGSLKLNERWSLNVGTYQSETDASDDFSDPNGRLEIFRLPLTSEFDAANVVKASYESELSGLNLNAVYAFDESLDFIVGFGTIDLDERFRIVSDDNGSVGIGRYTIRAENEMQGLHVGVAFSRQLQEKLGVYVIGKLGSYDNDTEQRQHVADTSFTRTNRDSSSTSARVIDLRLGLNYYFTEQLSVDFGYYLVSIDDVALAESQFDTTAAGIDDVVDDDDVDWDGYSLGLKYTF